MQLGEELGTMLRKLPPNATANLRGKSASRNMEWRSLVGPSRRHSRIGPGIFPLHRDLYKGFSLGVTDYGIKVSTLKSAPVEHVRERRSTPDALDACAAHSKLSF